MHGRYLCNDEQATHQGGARTRVLSLKHMHDRPHACTHEPVCACIHAHSECRYSNTLKRVALQALDVGMIRAGFAWLGTADMIRAEEAVILGSHRLDDAKQALSGWLYLHDDQEFPPGFVEAVKARTAADFGTTNELDISPYAMLLYDVRMISCFPIHNASNMNA